MAAIFLFACSKDEQPPAGGSVSDRVEWEAPVQSDCAPADLEAAIAAGSWDPGLTVSGFTGHDGYTSRVYDFSHDAEGRLLAAGRFQWAGGEAVDPLVVLEDGTWKNLDVRWDRRPPPEGFSAVEATEEGIFLATHATREPHEGELWLQRGDGVEVIASFRGAVRELLWREGALWVLGDFRIDGEEGIGGLAIWDGIEWSTLPGGPPNGAVLALYEDEERIWVGGWFTHIGGIDAHFLAAWDGSEWTAQDMVGEGLEPGPVYAIAAFQGDLYVGTSSQAAGRMLGEKVGGIARKTEAGWELVGGGLAAGSSHGLVSSLLVHDGALYASGCFNLFGGSQMDPTAQVGGTLLRWTGDEWEAADRGGEIATVWVDDLVCGDESQFAIWDAVHQRMAVHGEAIFLAGSFPGAGGVVSQGMIAFDGERWLAQAQGSGGIAGAVGALHVAGEGCDLFAVGGSHAGGTPIPSGIAKRVGKSWEPFASPLPEGLMHCAGIAVDGRGDFFAGCSVEPSYVGEDVFPLGKVFRWDGSDWVAMGEPHELREIHAIEVDPAGGLWIAGGDVKGYVAKWNGATFEVVEDRFDGMVHRMAFRNTKRKNAAEYPLVVGGDFSMVGGVRAERIAHWDGDEWSALGEGLPTLAEALAYGQDGAIYVSNQVNVLGLGEAGERFVLGKWDGESWEEIATPRNGIPAPYPGTDPTFLKLRPYGEHLLAVGYVWPEDGKRNVFVYDGSRFTAIAGGVRAIDVRDVALTPTGLWFGGSIAEVVARDGETLPSVGVARFGWEGPAK